MQWEVQQEDIQLAVNSIRYFRFPEEQKYKTSEDQLLQSFGLRLVNGPH